MNRGSAIATITRGVVVALFLGCGPWLSPVLAQPLLSTDVSAQAGGPETLDVSALSQTSPGPLPLSDSRVAVAVDAGAVEQSAFARAFADYGILRAQAISLTTGSGLAGFAASGAVAAFADELIFTGAAPGTLGTATLSIYVDGSVSDTSGTTGFGAASAYFTLNADDALARRVSSNIFLTSPGGYLAQTVSVSVSFVFGQAFDVSAELSVFASSFSEGTLPGIIDTTAGVSDFWNTARWSGISDVRDANGSLLASWSVSSASGTDYAGAFLVPESSAALLLLTSGAAFLSRRAPRRRRSARAAAILALGALPFWSGAAEAAPLLQVDGRGVAEIADAASVVDDQQFSEQSGQASLSETVFASATTAIQSATTLVRGRADFGQLGAEVIAQATSNADPNQGGGETFGRNQATGIATVSFLDELTIVGGAPGTLGFATFLLIVDGATSTASTHAPDPRTSVVDAFAIVRLTGVADSPGATPVTAAANPLLNVAFSTILTIDVPFTFGELVLVEAELIVGAQAFADGDGPGELVVSTGVSDFWSTARWGGVAAVRDASGASLASWSVTSASGTDYAQAFPVPEPTTVALLGLATGGAGLRRGLGSRGGCARALALGLRAPRRR